MEATGRACQPLMLTCDICWAVPRHLTCYPHADPADPPALEPQQLRVWKSLILELALPASVYCSYVSAVEIMPSGACKSPVHDNRPLQAELTSCSCQKPLRMPVTILCGRFANCQHCPVSCSCSSAAEVMEQMRRSEADVPDRVMLLRGSGYDLTRRAALFLRNSEVSFQADCQTADVSRSMWACCWQNLLLLQLSS